MEGRLNYIFSPQTLISIVVSVIGIAVAWTKLNSKVNQIEKDVKEIQ